MISNVLKLKRNIETESYKFIGTVKVEESRPYIVSVLKLGLEYGIKKPIKPELIIENLLPGEPLAVARNIVNRFIQLGLINENGTLTTLGEEGAKGKVFMPQSGEFTICVTEDPLIRNGVLAIDWGQNAQEDRSKLNNKDEGKWIERPAILERCKGLISQVWFNGKIKEVYVDDIKNKVIKSSRKPEIKLEISLDLVPSKSYMKIIKDSSFITDSLNVPLELKKFWNDIVIKKNMTWEGDPLDQGINFVNYSETNPEERKTFTRTVSNFEINVPPYGKFKVEPLTIKLQPKSDADATKWAYDLIRAELKDYIGEREYFTIANKVSKRFTTRKPRIPQLKEFMEYLYLNPNESNKGIPPEYWYLRAPSDLIMEEN